MKTKKTTNPAPATKQLMNIETAQLDNVLGGCACGCNMPNCPQQMQWR